MLSPVLIAATSPLLAYREAVHIVAGFAGIVCLALLLIQPLLAARYLPGLDPMEQRTWHRRVGAGIILCVALHVGGLFAASPADALDALLLVSPTPFSVYGVMAMWGVVLTAVLVALRGRLGIRYSVWRLIHNGLALVVVVATVVHAVQIEGAMEAISKWLLCIAALLATVLTLLHLRVIRPLTQRRR
ncbi:MAG: ferric reductase-like transmembrane domain-containing protein [Hyphomicrobiaceae bacterium]